MKIHVQFTEGDDPSAHWRKAITLPKKWLQLPCERLRDFSVENYNKAKPTHPQLEAGLWHLRNESEAYTQALGSQNVIEDVIGPFDEVYLKPGRGFESTEWRRATVTVPKAVALPVLVPVDHALLLALRESVDVDDTEALRKAVEKGCVVSPHDVLMSETDVKDEKGRICGTEWHALGGRFAWDTEADGHGEEASAKVTLSQYAKLRCAHRVLSLIDVTDHFGAPVLGGRSRAAEDIEASAATMASSVEEMNRQLVATETDAAGG
eukprot:TRINITY_DN25095_c0_g1_i1.p1 TRINITY_DN25095_c0_g1~~TRINITY_DN25095_c0_g1_i1.p1  ORF type:complete len:265 (-),score=47.04 TRINITY_DN25095_c0_g1_i1:74-868(-)